MLIVSLHTFGGRSFSSTVESGALSAAASTWSLLTIFSPVEVVTVVSGGKNAKTCESLKVWIFSVNKVWIGRFVQLGPRSNQIPSFMIWTKDEH